MEIVSEKYVKTMKKMKFNRDLFRVYHFWKNKDKNFNFILKRKKL
jgi:hypothetical protein